MRLRPSTAATVGSGVAIMAMLGTAGVVVAQDPDSGCEERPTLIEWDGDAGTAAWSEPTNWVADAVPGPGSHVCIALAGTTVVIDSGPASVASLQVLPGATLGVAGSGVLELAGPEHSLLASFFMSGGSLSGAGTRTVTESAILDQGTLTGAGRTVIAPEARLQVGSGAGGTLTIDGGHVLAIDAGATAVWGPGPHDIVVEAPSRLENAGELTITNDRVLRGSGTLANTGSLRKLSHGTTSLGLLLDDDGSIAIEGGTIDAAGGDGGLGSDGVITIAERSRLRLRDGATTLGATAAISGAGELELTTNASLTVPAGATYDIATTYLTGGALTLDGERSLSTLGIWAGSLAGAGTRTVTESAILDQGTLTGAGRTVIAPEARLQVGSGAGGTLTIDGGHVLAIDAGAAAVWGPGPHDIVVEAPSRLENAGELTITNDRVLRGSGTLANTGSLRKLSHGTTSLGLLLDDDGSIAIEAGTIDAAGGDGGLGSDGVITIAERSRLRLRDGATTLGATAAISGAGELELTTNASLTVPAGATYDIATTYLTGGALTLDGERSLSTLGIWAGSLAGAGTRTVTESAILDQGTLTGAGRTVIAPEARLQVGSGAGGTLTIDGGHVLAIDAGAAAVWGPGPHDIVVEAPSRLENAGELTITNDRVLRGSGTLANTGSLRKLSHGTTSLGLLLDDDGSIAIEAGTIDAAGGDGGLGSDGVITIAERSRLRLRDGATTLGATAAISGAGELELTTNASLTVPAGATYDIATTYLTGGALTLDGERSLPTLGIWAGSLTGAGTRTVTESAILDQGTLTGAGRTVIAPEARLQVGSGAGGTLTIDGGHVLAIDAGAAAVWGPGPHDIVVEAPSRLENAGELTITNDRVLRGSGTLANTGSLRKLSHGTTSVALAPADGSRLANEGTIEVLAGLLEVGGTGLDDLGSIVLGASGSTVGQIRTATYRQGETGALQVGVAGTTPHARSGILTVTLSDVSLAGALEITADESFSATASQTLTLLSTPAGSTDLEFDTVSGVDTLPGAVTAELRGFPEGIVLVIGE